MALRVALGGATDPNDFSTARVAAAIGYARRKGAKIINMSFFRRTTCADNPGQAPCNNYFADAAPELRMAYQDGMVLVACAGNYTEPGVSPTILTKLSYPAAFGYVTSANEGFDVIGVAATDNTNVRARGFACAGDTTTPSDGCITLYGNWVDISAPGKDILSDVPVGLSDNSGDPLYSCAHPDGSPAHIGYCRSGGSSFAAAHVSGVAALILSRNPDWQNQYVCGATYTERCNNQHDYVRDLMKKYHDPANALSGLAGMGAGLLDAGSTVGNVISLPVELPPVWIYPDPVNPTISGEVMMNGAFGFGLAASDPEGEPVTIRAVSIPQGSELESWTWDPDEDGVDEIGYSFYWPSALYGDHTVTFAASDGVNPEVNLTLQLHVEPHNYPPVFGPLPTDGNIYFDSNTILFCGPANGDTIILRGGQTFSFQFNVTDTNNFGVCIDDLMAPIFDPIGTINDANTTCSGYLGFDGWVDYPHNGPGPFNYTWQAPSNIPSGGQRSFHLRFVALDEKLGAFDDLGNISQSVTVSDDFDIYVNDPPVFVNPPIIVTGTVDGPAVTFTLNAMDPNGNTPSVYMTNSLPGASFNSSTRTFTMSTAQAGTFVANFQTLDGCEVWYSPYPNAYTTTHSVTIVINGPDAQDPSAAISTPTGSSTTSKRLITTVTDNQQLKWLRHYIDQSCATNQSATPYQTWPISGTSYTKDYTPSVSLSYSTTHTYCVEAEDMAGRKYRASRSFYYYSSGGGSGGGGGGGGGSGTKDTDGNVVAVTTDWGDLTA